MVVEHSLSFVWDKLGGRTWTFFLTNGISIILLVSCSPVSIIALFCCHYFLSSTCYVLLSFHIISLLLLLSFLHFLFLTARDMLYFKLRVYQKQPLYPYEVRVKSTYPLSSPNPTCVELHWVCCYGILRQRRNRRDKDTDTKKKEIMGC